MFEAIKDRRMEADDSLRRCQLSLLYILDVVNEICQKCGVEYWLVGGSKLGAARHAGFIPWDDDIDIGIKEEETNRFVNAMRTMLPYYLMVKDESSLCTSRHRYLKIIDRRTFYCEDRTIVAEPCGIFIDVFPWERVPKWSLKFQKKLDWLRYSSWRHAGDAYLRVRRLALAKIYDCFMCMLYRSIFYIVNSIVELAKVVWPSTIRHAKSCMDMTYYDESIMFPLQTMKFESGCYPCFRDMETALAIKFGNWRELPPEDKRTWHATIICPTQAPDVSWALKWGNDK